MDRPAWKDAMTKPRPDQFEFAPGERLAVKHKPTGATFSSLRYPDPRHTKIKSVNPGRAGEQLENGEAYSVYELRRLALELLRNRACGMEPRQSDRGFFYA